MFEGKIPFDQHGNPQPYARYNSVMKPNERFKIHVYFVGFRRGRSAAHALYHSSEYGDWEAVMFLTDLEQVIKNGYAPASLEGEFEYTRRGSNFGFKLIKIA